MNTIPVMEVQQNTTSAIQCSYERELSPNTIVAHSGAPTDNCINMEVFDRIKKPIVKLTLTESRLKQLLIADLRCNLRLVQKDAIIVQLFTSDFFAPEIFEDPSSISEPQLDVELLQCILSRICFKYPDLDAIKQEADEIISNCELSVALKYMLDALKPKPVNKLILILEGLDRVVLQGQLFGYLTATIQAVNRVVECAAQCDGVLKVFCLQAYPVDGLLPEKGLTYEIKNLASLLDPRQADAAQVGCWRLGSCAELLTPDIPFCDPLEGLVLLQHSILKSKDLREQTSDLIDKLENNQVLSISAKTFQNFTVEDLDDCINIMISIGALDYRLEAEGKIGIRIFRQDLIWKVKKFCQSQVLYVSASSS